MREIETSSVLEIKGRPLKSVDRDRRDARTEPLQSNAGASNFTYGFLGSNWWQGRQFKQFGFWTNDVA